AEDRSGPWLWALDVEQKVVRRVTSGLEQYTSVAATADSRRIIASVASPTAHLWSLQITDRVLEDSDLKLYPTPTMRALGPRFRGSSLFEAAAMGCGGFRTETPRSLEGVRRSARRAGCGFPRRPSCCDRAEKGRETARHDHVGGRLGSTKRR